MIIIPNGVGGFQYIPTAKKEEAQLSTTPATSDEVRLPYCISVPIFLIALALLVGAVIVLIREWTKE